MTFLESGQLLSNSHLPVVFCKGGRGDVEFVCTTLDEREGRGCGGLGGGEISC